VNTGSRIPSFTLSQTQKLVWRPRIRSCAHWEVVEHAARAYREHGFWGVVARTNSGPEDPVWHECPERLQRVNAVFRGREAVTETESAMD